MHLSTCHEGQVHSLNLPQVELATPSWVISDTDRPDQSTCFVYHGPVSACSPLLEFNFQGTAVIFVHLNIPSVKHQKSSMNLY